MANEPTSDPTIEETFGDAPALPPAFTAHALGADDSALERALAKARAGEAEAGDLFFPVRPDRAEAALVLAPEQPFAKAGEVIYVAMAALNDALGSAIPAQIGVLLGWPDRVLLNGAETGHLTYVTANDAPDAVPDWMVVGFELTLMGDPRVEPGTDLGQTNFYEEGASELSPKEILEAFARHFMNWLHRWETEGMKHLGPAWEERMAGLEAAYPFPVEGRPVPARAAGIGPEGVMRIVVDGAERHLPLSQAWRRDAG